MMVCQAISLIALLVLSSSFNHHVNGQENNDKSPKIVIVGAGAAGIAAATKLHENGFRDITILEAEPRLGGRVYTRTFGEYVVDMGGQWVHGQKGNAAYELAHPLGLLEVPQVERESYGVFSDGERVPKEINDKIGGTFDTVQSTHPNKTEGSVGDHFREGFNKMFKESPEITEEMQREIMFLIERVDLSYESADNWDQVSLNGFIEYEEAEGRQDVNWKDRGYSTILDVLMKKIPNPAEELPIESKYLKLNSTVTQIDYGDELKGAEITTRDGEKIQADHVIVTVSLGVLKEKKNSLFTPALSEKKIKTIDNLEIGSVTKIYMSFDENPFQNMVQNSSDNEPGFLFLWKEADKQKLIETSPEKKWMLDVYGAFSLTRRPKMICFWVVSQGARESEKLSDETVKEHVTELLQRFLKNETSAKPKEILRTKWYSNENFRGTYSYRSLKSESENVWAKDLGEPIMKNDKPVVLFAGEATNERQYSTVHGAISSGWREADRLTKLYKA